MNLNRAKLIIQAHYSIMISTGPISEKEIQNEIDSLNRKQKKGTLDNMDESLYFQLVQSGDIVENE